MLDIIRKAGVVGCGGAGFPTHAKLNCQVEYIIINGAECEPLLQTDKYLMRHFAMQIVSAAERCRQQIGATRAYIALKDYYRAESDALQQAIDQAGYPVELVQLKNYYPAGDEQMIVYQVTGRVVPPGGIPLDVGAVVSNVATMLAVYDATENRPFTHKYLTVAGEVSNPCLIHAAIGTPLSACLDAAGTGLDARCGYIVGGPMMGKLYCTDELSTQVVTKTLSGIIVLNDLERRKIPTIAQMINRARSVCIQCHYCSDMCPRHLLGHPLEPHKIMRKLALCGDVEQLLDDADIRRAAICCECGVCEAYACPMGLAPCSINAMIKGKLAAAGIRYSKGEGVGEPHILRDYRLVPTQSLIARLGLSRYSGLHLDKCVELKAHKVEIPLKQHAGAPAQAIVSKGDQVVQGQLIGEIPDKALGAQIHSSLDGRVTKVTKERIFINGGRA